MPVLSKIRPVKCWDLANRRRFPVRFPRFTVIVPDFQRNNTQGGDYLKLLLDLNVGNGKLLLGVKGNCVLHQCDVAEFDNNSQLT